MLPTQFNNGNFNIFEALVKEILPEKLHLIRRDLIPAVDRVLRSMLGENTRVEKDSINITQKYTQDKGLVSLDCTLVYNCFDFLVPNAPEKAIEEDVESIKSYLTFKDVETTKVSIDTKTGYFTVVFNIPVDRS